MKALLLLAAFLAPAWAKDEVFLSVTREGKAHKEFTKLFVSKNRWFCRTEEKEKIALDKEPDLEEELAGLRKIPSIDPCENRVFTIHEGNLTVSCAEASGTKKLLRTLGRLCGRF
jgi:hypothetical protein